MWSHYENGENNILNIALYSTGLFRQLFGKKQDAKHGKYTQERTEQWNNAENATTWNISLNI